MSRVDTDERRENVSAMMLFPCLKIKQELVRQFKEFGFVNTYLFWEDREYPFYPVYVVFRPAEFTHGFYQFTLGMERSLNYVETIDAPGVLVFVYAIPAQFGADYLLVLNGAYSLTSPDFKSCFQMKLYKYGPNGQVLKTSSGAYDTEYSMWYHIFNKTDFLRNKWREALGDDIVLPKDMELYEKCDMDKETLKL